jgi:serine phosphatase RsbU (regulator of sigma subunit)
MPQAGPADDQLRLLLVEDDDGDALLVEEHLADAGQEQRYLIARARSVGDAAPLIDRADCALVDLGLPDAHGGISALTQLRAMGPELPIVVLTGVAEQARGLDAVASGAQDYLVKGQVDGAQLTRSLRYAIERRRAERDARLLLVAEQRQAENDRLARGLLPLLDVDGACAVTTRYRPGADALLGGDFFDALVLPDGRLRVVIGDVCGHGAAEAALGVALRIAWRTMTLAGSSEADSLATVEQVLLRERDESLPFATVCDITLDPEARTLTTRRHGHPAPLLVVPEVRWLDTVPAAPPLGCFPESKASEATVDLPDGWSLLLMTDGIFEGRVPTGGQGGRLGTDGLAGMVARQAPTAASPDALLDGLIAEAQELNGGDLEDDLALLWIGDVR